MNPQTEILVRTLIPVLFLVVLVYLKQWQILLGISILAASTGFFFLHAYIVGDTRGYNITRVGNTHRHDGDGRIRIFKSYIYLTISYVCMAAKRISPLLTCFKIRNT